MSKDGKMIMEFDQVEYTYPCTYQPVIKNLNLQIPENRRCALIGRNGCGKTTLFRLANGLYHPQKGIIRWFGKPLRYDRTSLNQLRQNVGLVFQDPEQQLVATTVEEDISYGLCNLNLPTREIAERVQQVMEEFELTELADKPVNYLSLGQKKRVAIADIMVLKPQLLLLDEPTAYLDPSQIRNLLITLKNIQDGGTTILIATHNLDFAYTWADWIFVMEKGKIILEGDPETVFTQAIIHDLGIGVPLAVSFLETLTDVLTENRLMADNQTQIQIIKQCIFEKIKNI